MEIKEAMENCGNIVHHVCCPFCGDCEDCNCELKEKWGLKKFSNEKIK